MTTHDVTLPRSARLARPAAIPARVRRAAPLGLLLLATALLYLWALDRNGYANDYYAAAVQAGTHSWEAFLFGSLDAANHITVDKPPASLWLMELSGRLFGFSSFSMLLPQALEGVAAVWLLYAAVRRWFSTPAALVSGAVLALTPVAALMFRFNQPDALLVLLLVATAYAVTRALERGATRWLALAGALLGLAFLTKMMQAFVVVPAFALVYLVAAPVPVRRRVWQLLVGALALVATAGWWVALVELVPASSRPYIGGSTNNSILDLVFGYNGLERLGGAGPGGGPGGGAGFSGPAGITRLFDAQVGGQISWLLPAALIALVAGAVAFARRPRTDRTRAALLLWGGWLVVTAALYSFMTGVIHPYYTNTLAPPIAVIVGVGTTLLWQRRRSRRARFVLAAMLVAAVGWSYSLLARTPGWHPWLRVAVLAGGLAAAYALVVVAPRRRAALAATAAVALAAALAGPTAYTFTTVARAESGPMSSAGPASAGSGLPPGPGGGALGPGGTGGGAAGTSRALSALLERGSPRYVWVAATGTSQTAASLELATGRSVMSIGGFVGTDRSITLTAFERLVAAGKIHYYIADGRGAPPLAFPGGLSRPGAGGPPPGLAVPGPGRGAGGFGPPGGGFGPPPGGGFGPAGPGRLPPPSAGGAPGIARPGGGGVASEIQTWIARHYKAQAVDGTTVYDLSRLS